MEVLVVVVVLAAASKISVRARQVACRAYHRHPLMAVSQNLYRSDRNP